MAAILKAIKRAPLTRPLLWAFHALRARAVPLLNAPAHADYRRHASEFRLSAAEQQQLETLRRDGVLILDSFFDAATIDAIYERLERLLADPANRDRTQANAFNHEDKLRLDQPLARLPELAPLIFDETICKIAAAYKGFVPTHIHNVYTTLPGSRLQGSSYFHRDDLGDMSVFIYLHDVDDHSGAAYYVKGSHGYHRKSFQLLSNYEKGLNDPNAAYSDEEVERYYPRERWVRPHGRRGTVVMMDVTGIHKGPYWELGDARNRPRTVVHLVFRQRNLFRSGFVPPRTIPEAARAARGAAAVVARQYAGGGGA